MTEKPSDEFYEPQIYTTKLSISLWYTVFS